MVEQIFGWWGASPENVLELLGHKLKRQLIVELRNVLKSFSQYRILIAENRIYSYILKVNNQLMRIPVGYILLRNEKLRK